MVTYRQAPSGYNAIQYGVLDGRSPTWYPVQVATYIRPSEYILIPMATVSSLRASGERS